ncbi:hypothetical protein POV90_21700 [Enterobacter roggenkampii]|uniref:hypothetical protein n=1 Tax=Enterobacter roggenkampii TaxID=1812935 RepID=UPI002FF9AB4A
MTANKPMTGEQLDELMTVAVNMQRDAETDCNRPSAMFAYAVQVAVLELRKVRNDAAALAAEYAGLKAGVTYFAYSPDYGFDYFKDKQSAIDTAQDEIDAYRDDADGWSDDVQRVSWGVVVQQAQGFDDQGLHTSDSRHTYQTCNYRLVDAVKTPATDAFLAEVRAQGVEMFAAHKRERQQALRSRSMRMSEEAAGMAADAEDFADQIRKGVQS